MFVTNVLIKKKIFFSKDTPKQLKRFESSTQKIIMNCFKESKKHVQEDDEDSYLDPFLLIIEWEEGNLLQRGIPKETIVNRMSCSKIINIMPFFFLLF